MLTLPKIDWKLVAEKAGYKSAASAQETFRHFMKKFKEPSGPIDGPLTTPQSHTETFRKVVSTPPAPPKAEKMKPKSTDRKRKLMSENGESGSVKKQRTKNKVGSDKEDNVPIQRLTQEQRARVVLSDDSDEYVEG